MLFVSYLFWLFGVPLERIFLLHNHFKSLWQRAGYTVGTYTDNATDVEASATAQVAHQAALILCEMGSAAWLGTGITHAVEKHSLETLHAEGNIKESVVNGGTYTGCCNGTGLGEASALEAVVANDDEGWIEGEVIGTYGLPYVRLSEDEFEWYAEIEG